METAKLLQFVATMCLGPITFGASCGWSSPVLPQLQNQNSTSPFKLTVEEGSWVGSMLAIGVLCSAIPSGYLADRFGPKRCIIAFALPNVIFTVIVFFSKDVYSLCIARFISGIAGGGVSVISPMYTADIADVSVRGNLGSFFEFLIFVGVIIMSSCGAYVDYVVLTIIMGACSLTLGIAFLFFPDSPTYLIKIGKKDQAIAALKFYRSQDYDVTKDIEVICNSLQEQQQRKKISIRKALTTKSMIRGLIACVGLTIFQQLSAIDAVVFYSVHIFQEARTIIDAYTSAIILSVVQLLSAVLAVFVIEKADRRTFLYLSTFCCGISLGMLGIYFHIHSFGIHFVGIDYIPLISLIIFAVGFAIGLGPVLWMLNVGLGPITYGASICWTSPVLPKLQDQNSTLPFTLTIEEGTWVGSMLAIGVLSAAIPSGYFADRFGLKKCVIAMALPHVIFALIVVFTKDVYSLCIARFFSGIAGGGVSVISPMYTADISEVSLRGNLGSFFEFLIFFGFILMSVCGAYVDYITLTIILGTLSLTVGIGFLFFPDSPTYLIKIGKKDEAVRALQFYRSDDYDVGKDIEIISNSIKEQQQAEKVNIGKALMTKTVLRGLIACVGLTIYQQLSAFNAVSFYSVYIFQESSSEVDAYTSAIILTVAELMTCVLVVFVIEKAGRRVFLYLSAFNCGLGLAILGIHFNLLHAGINFSGAGYIPIISLVIFSVGYTLGLGPVLWLLNGELFSHEVKGIANGIIIATSWVFLFMSRKHFPFL
ncbi:hypothetical protein FQR65_LT05973 [Abscondita terminalis]|nr:hypothetical protein FQR65_LT05973 [Abscondita terminalis]